MKKLIHIRALIWLTLKTAVQEVSETRRDALWVLWWLCGRCNLVQNFKQLIIIVLPRRFIGHHLVHSASKTPNISESIVTCLFNHFRCHPIWRATEAFCVGFLGFYYLFWATKICKCASSIISDENIGSFYISMHDVIVMKIFEAK